MLKNTINKILLPLIGIILVSGFLLTSTEIGENVLEQFSLSPNKKQKKIIRKYLVPYRVISRLQKELNELYSSYYSTLTDLELSYKESGIEISTHKKTEKLFDDKTIDKYKLIQGFYAGINVDFPDRKFGVSSWNNSFTSKIKLIIRTLKFSFELRKRVKFKDYYENNLAKNNKD